MVNEKKAGAPREAAMAICQYINHRNPNVSLLALSLLDICVKNCGYPFHLQISTKEFLNELVRRFPERPPIRTTRVQNRILELIEEWRRTICETSKYKEDLGFIRDMHRLLHYKGYQFPQISREDAAVLNPSDNLKSAEEMEAEERAAQSAKLQELIRRGTPHDLQEANKLMKVMAGYDTRHKTDYRAKAAEEVAGIQQKAKLLEEMMQGLKPGETVKEGDVFEELASALASAHPKIQKMCSEESDDHEAVHKLLEINDSIFRTLKRYRHVKEGDMEAANAIQKGTLGVSGAGVTQGAGGELSLIDFGGPEEASTQVASESAQPSAPAQPKPKGNALEDDLLGLDLGDGNFGQGGGVSLGDASNGTADIMAQFDQPQQSASNSIFNTTQKAAPPQSSQGSNFNLFSSFPSSAPLSKPATPIPSSQPPQKKADPFAALNTPSRQPSPFQHAPPKAPASVPQPVDLLGMGSSNGTTATVADDDEWEFSSALPDQSTEITVTNSSIRTTWKVSRSSDTELLIESSTSNTTAQPITDLKFQLAAQKVCPFNLPHPHEKF